MEPPILDGANSRISTVKRMAVSYGAEYDTRTVHGRCSVINPLEKPYLRELPVNFSSNVSLCMKETPRSDRNLLV